MVVGTAAASERLYVMQRKGRIRKSRWVIIGVIALTAVGTLAYLPWRGMPRVAWNALNDADQYELLSLYPYLSKPDYYNHEILGRTMITDPAVRDRLNRAFQAGVRESDGKMMACFNPRHGIRVTHAGITTDFVICFECRQVQVFRENQKIAFFLVSDLPQPAVDDVLKSAGVPLASKEP